MDIYEIHRHWRYLFMFACIDILKIYERFGYLYLDISSMSRISGYLCIDKLGSIWGQQISTFFSHQPQIYSSDAPKSPQICVKVFITV